MLQARKRQTITTASQEFTLTPGYQYTLFVGPFETGEVTVDFIGSDRSSDDYTVASGLGTISSVGRVAVITAITENLLVTLSNGASDVYVEINVVKSVGNAQGYV